MNKNVIHKDGGLYNIGMQRLISVDSYGDTFVIPDGVKYIGECAFWKCEELKSVNIPNSVIDIGTSAFAGCESLKKINIPDSVERIHTDAFAYCYSLEEITLPTSLKFMSYCAFYGCNSLKKINYCNHSFIVDEILPVGLHLFCGASKVGKSWCMLDLCIKVSQGQPIWELQTNKCDVLYFALEDTYTRLQQRLQRLTDEIDSNLHFTTTAKTIQNGFMADLQDYIKKYPNTRLIIIDTLQKIRRTSDNMSYSTDYQDISILKKFADDNKLAIILVHHLRKQEDNDVFNKLGNDSSKFINFTNISRNIKKGNR